MSPLLTLITPCPTAACWLCQHVHVRLSPTPEPGARADDFGRNATDKSGCANAADSGLMGQPCGPDLKKHCTHPTFGATMRHNCRVTCQMCSPPCADRAGSGVMGLSCAAVKAHDLHHGPIKYCLDPTNGAEISKNCPLTCKACEPGARPYAWHRLAPRPPGSSPIIWQGKFGAARFKSNLIMQV